MLKDQVLKFNDLVNKKASAADTEAKQEALVSFLRHGARGLVKMYPQEFSNTLKDLKITQKLSHLGEVAEIMNSELEAYKINDSTGKMTLRLKDQVVVDESLFDLGAFIETQLGLKKDHEMFYLLLGFFSDPKYYELIQMYETAIKISE